MTNIYILKCEDNKFYVGKTNDIEKRLEEHFNDEKYASAWTSYYSPIKLKRFIENQDDYDEDKWVIRMMANKGIENVRGGSFSRVILPDEDKMILQRMIDGARDQCLICGDNNHFALQCPDKDTLPKKIEKKRKLKNNVGYNIGKSITKFGSAILEGMNDNKEDFDKNKCNRCGREGHKKKDCYAKSDINGKRL